MRRASLSRIALPRPRPAPVPPLSYVTTSYAIAALPEDPCLRNKCRNGATCTRDASEAVGFVCKCTPQFRGTYCTSSG